MVAVIVFLVLINFLITEIFVDDCKKLILLGFD